MRRYPIGIQTFSKIREGNYIYVDKTGYVYNLAHTYQYVFLSRPRRFGKSLLTTTFESFFEGRKDLFSGLKAGEMEKEWVEYPVLHFDMSKAKHLDAQGLTHNILLQLHAYEQIYGSDDKEITTNDKLEGVIKRASDLTGKKVVVLIDEYDAPLLDVLTSEDDLEQLRQIMRNFYSPLKACDEYLRFVFITGITKFSQLSIFSELNNLQNISMNPEFAAICGISKEEMLDQLDSSIEEFAKYKDISKQEAIELLKDNYDGYHFTYNSPDIFNPFSLLQVLQNKNTDAYWFGSGTPTFLLQEMKKFNVKPEDIKSMELPSTAFDVPTETMDSIIPLLYQSGYLTIKAYNKVSRMFTLDIPNTEVRAGIMGSLLPYVIQNAPITKAQALPGKMYEAIYEDDFDKMMDLLKTFLGTVPYSDNTNYEGHYQSLLFVVFSLLCQYVDIEVHTPRGRVDVVFETRNKLYLLELKLDDSVDKAMEQINLNDYSERFALSAKQVVKVGVNFSSKTRNITDWKMM